VPFATFPLYPPRADVRADIVEPPVSARSGCEQSQQGSALFDHLIARRPARDQWFSKIARSNADRQRPPGRRATDERDELAPFHSITSSARSRNDSGIVR
jgi:hypothetical protein